MRKKFWLKIINPIIGVLFINQALSGVMNGLIPYPAFKFIHGAAGYLFGSLVLIHVILNRSWFKTAFHRENLEKTNDNLLRRKKIETLHL